MGMTLTEKILADHAGQREVRPGELVDCRLDLLMGNDITAGIAIKEFEKAREIMAAGGLMKYLAKKKGLTPRGR